jgi:hypothetical protein
MVAALLAVSLPVSGLAQSAAPAAANESVEQRLQRLEQRQAELEAELKQKDAEIQALKPPTPGPAATQPASGAPATAAGAATATPAAAAPPVTDDATLNADNEWGTYKGFQGFKVANTDQGDLNVAIYTYVRYLNQMDLDPTYTNAFGKTSEVQRRQEVQIVKVQIKFLGWIMDPKFRYFLYAWSSNATQGQGAQVVLAGNLSYAFNDYLTVAGGITSLPGVRTTEGNFPFWLNVDNRMMADEFFRPSYTSGFWVRGNITKSLRYQAMIGNNLSTLGVSSAQLDNRLNTIATALVWTPTTGEFGTGFGDFENHQDLATRLGLHYTHSTETKQSQPNNDNFENTQIRLSDGSIIFTPGLFGPGITVDQVRYQMMSLDGGLKYRGAALEGEWYWRKLDQFEGAGVGAISNKRDTGFQLQASYFLVPATFQVYAATSKIYGQYGQPWDVRGGVNWHPFHNRVFRWNAQAMYLDRSPVGYTSLTYNVGSKGMVFNTDFELAF